MPVVRSYVLSNDWLLGATLRSVVFLVVLKVKNFSVNHLIKKKKKNLRHIVLEYSNSVRVLREQDLVKRKRPGTKIEREESNPNDEEMYTCI